MSEIENFRFRPHNGPLWYPQSDVFDWRSVFLSKIALRGDSEPLGLTLTLGEHEQDVTTDNTTLFLNRALQDLDALRITDVRDERQWWWFRGTDPSFDGLARMISPLATIVLSNCPKEWVEAQYLQHRELMLETGQVAVGDEEIAGMIAELDDPNAVQRWLSEG